MNSNMFHNIANLAMVALAMLSAGLMATGCVQNAAGAVTCAASWLDPKLTMWGIGALGALKVLVNLVRDGFGGLFKPQPPVQP